MKPDRIVTITKWLIALIVVLAFVPCLVKATGISTLEKQLIEAVKSGDLNKVASILNAAQM